MIRVFCSEQCNNPKTKEPKLTAAMRIIPEWKGRDAEIRRLWDRVYSQPQQPSSTPHSEFALIECTSVNCICLLYCFQLISYWNNRLPTIIYLLDWLFKSHFVNVFLRLMKKNLLDTSHAVQKPEITILVLVVLFGLILWTFLLIDKEKHTRHFACTSES